jgi:nitrite reductase/ring-hydroxylating ferredoxin subunit
VNAPTRARSWRCRADTVPPGRGRRFQIAADSGIIGGFIANHAGRHRAYVNRCPHAGAMLDTRPNEFFTEDGRALVCGTHGAVFDPDTGICTEGPCPGARLEPLAVSREGEDVVVTCRD